MPQAEDILEKFGRHLRKLRQSRGISQEQFAEICDLDRTYISGIERGRRNVSLKNLQAIADGLGTSLEGLFSGMKY